ncbi:MAG: TolC family protein [Phycisphaerae bacterium]
MLFLGGDFSRWSVRRLRWSGFKTFVEKHTRTALLWLGCVLIAILPLGCIKVNPTPDYAHASALIAERTGSGDVYDPQTESLIKDKISVLLADRLTTAEAVQLALLNNRPFQSAFHEIGVSRAEVVRSGLLSNPSLFTSARFPDGGGRSNLTFGFGQELADLWQIPIRKRIAKAKLEQTVLSVVRRAIDLAADVRIRCYQFLALLEAEKIAQENLTLVERSVKLAEDRFHAGEVGQLDVNLAKTNLLDVKLKLIALKRQRRIARADLAWVLGLARWDLPWTLIDDLPMEPLPAINPDEWVLYAMRQRLDAQAAALQTRAAEAEIKRQYLSIIPSVTLGVEGERQERRSLPGRKVLADTARASVASGGLTAPGIQSRGQRNLERSQIIDSLIGPTISLTLPIWHQNQAEIAKARFTAAQKRKDYEALLDIVANSVEASIVAARTADELVHFYKEEALPLARANVEAARRAYGAGEQSIVALIDAQRTLITQLRDYVDARRDYAIARAELQRAVGGQMPTTPSTTQPAEAEAGEQSS